MAGIQFNDYIVLKSSYEKNIHFDETTENLDMNMQFSCEIVEQETEATVYFSATCGSLEKTDSPFLVDVKVAGFFGYIEEENEGIDFRSYLTRNAIFILFPYVRSLMSELTLKSNEFPPLQLPVINIAKFMEEQDRIVYKSNPKI